MKGITIGCDGAADLGDIAGKRGIVTEPLTVILGDRSGADGSEITPADIFAYYDETKKTPKTAAVSPERYAALFESMTRDGGEAVYICAAQTKSSCYDNAVMAAKDYPGVYVVDSQSLSAGIGLLALYADDLRQTGKYTAAEIAEKVTARRGAINLSLIVDNMTFLHKGGRCSGVAAFIASVLRIHISLKMHGGGQLDVRKKYNINIMAFYVDYAGYLDYGNAYINHLAVRPVFYLNSSVNYASGNGTITNPIRVSA